MAVEILERDLGVPISDLAGSDVAYDIHVRRVFLRTGLADADDVGQMVANARLLNPDRPGSLDLRLGTSVGGGVVRLVLDVATAY